MADSGVEAVAAGYPTSSTFDLAHCVSVADGGVEAVEAGLFDHSHTNAGSPSTLTAKVSLGGSAGASSGAAAARPPGTYAKSARHVRTFAVAGIVTRTERESHWPTWLAGWRGRGRNKQCQ